MNKVVINSCYGGFSLSKEASEYLNERYNIGINIRFGFLPDGVSRHDWRLVEAVEKFGEDASRSYSKLEIKEIESMVYRIDEYDGFEIVVTPDLIDWVVIGDSK